MKKATISTIDPDKKSQYADDLVGKVIITVNQGISVLQRSIL